MSVIDEIKDKLEIVSYIQQTVPLKKSGRYYKACCPFHNERTPSFVVNEDTQSWRCFGACAEGGDIFSYAMKKHGWSFAEALRELATVAGVEVRPETPAQRQRSEHVELLRGLVQAAADIYHEHLFNLDDSTAAFVLDYLREERGFSEDTIRQYQLGYAPQGWQNLLDHLTQIGYSEDHILEAGLVRRGDTGRAYDYFRHRLMIPIRDGRGRVIGFGARALDPDDNPKYLNSPQTPLFDKSRTLFGLDAARDSIRERETVVIVEGYMDAIQAHQVGFYNVVAQMGTALTEAQLTQVAPRWAKKIVLALDTDSAGQAATHRSQEIARSSFEMLQQDFQSLLQQYMLKLPTTRENSEPVTRAILGVVYAGHLSLDIRILQVPDAKDPDDLIRESPERWQVLVDSAVPVADYVIEMETAALPANASVQEREAVAQRLLPILLASENNLYKKDNLQKLALRLHIAESDLIGWAQEQTKIERAKAPRRSSPRPPDEPQPMLPLDDDIMEPPSTANGAFQARDRQKLPSAATRREVPLELYCLRMLLRYPQSVYLINRKFRQLAANNPALLEGPLGDLSVEDFTHTQYRALMQAFQAALSQDDQDPMDYLRGYLDGALLSTLDTLLVEDLDEVRNRVRNVLPGDFSDAWKEHQKLALSFDLQAEVVNKALRLRKQRLQREREELCFLQLDAQTTGDTGAALEYGAHIMASNRAKRAIEAELERATRLLS